MVPLYYGIFGILAACISSMFVPAAFATANPVVSLAVYGAAMAFAMFASNKLELAAFDRYGTSLNANVLHRVFVRLGIYIGVPMVLCWLVGLTGLVLLPKGWLSALALTWMPLFLAAWLNYFPARR